MCRNNALRDRVLLIHLYELNYDNLTNLARLICFGNSSSLRIDTDSIQKMKFDINDTHSFSLL